MKAYQFTVPAKLPGLNEYTKACRGSRYEGAEMKKQAEKLVSIYIKQQMRGVRINYPVHLTYYWKEPNRKRDKDNVAGFGMKVIQDALVHSGVIPDDGWKYIDGFSHYFTVDPSRPGVTVVIEPVSEDT